MQDCEFCHSQFKPRPQVKSPRACGKQECQRERQRENEKAWHSRNPGIYDGKYHSVKRRERLQELRKIAGRLKECLAVGATMLGVTVDEGQILLILERFLLGLGIRTANKFCNV